MKITYIRSGGQTGVDRAALDAAREMGVPIAGWCPKGGLAEDYEDTSGGGLLVDYPELRETNYPGYSQRTMLNVWDADATLIFYPSKGDLSPGTQLTVDYAKYLKKPYLVVHNPEIESVIEWLEQLKIDEIELNVAGPRESSQPGIYKETKKFVKKIIKTCNTRSNT